DGEGVPETLFDEDGLMKKQSEEENMDNHDDMSEDPFRIYSLLKKKDKVVSNKDSEFSMKYPPGFTPNEGSDGASMHVEEGRGGNSKNGNEGNVDVDNVVHSGNHSGMNSKEGRTESVCSGYFKKSEVHRTGLAQKAKKDKVKELYVKNKVNFLALQETKMENMELFCVKTCWGNMAFDYVHSDSVGNSGGILCVWDPNAFCKSSVTMSDYFIMVRGVWRQNGKDFLIIVVYAPHDIKEKMMLWDYLTREIGRWKGEVVVMGDFNEVRNRSDRFGSVFNVQGANVFNSFISSAGLVEVSLGFSKIVEDAWKESPSDESNAMISMMGKLKFLKTKIREWNKTNMLCRKNVKAQCKADLEAVEVIIDSGNGNEEIAIKRTELVKNLQHIDKLNSLEIAQKAKVKWAIEGDENSSFFHGMLNKKRNTLSIRGIMVDGIWIDDPNLVKREFLMHFSSRFSKPDNRRALIQMRFPKRLSLEQQVELESEVSNEEIKRAVWDCGSDKAPGPDGFTFGFYRYFWYLIENDVYNDAVKGGGCGEHGGGGLSRGSSILNGSPTDEFQFYKGLKQGDPLSPFLFILIIESLHLSFQRVEDAKMFKEIKLGSSVYISHMFYADDAVFVGQWCESNINTLVHVLECFYRASGLRINMSKSKLMDLHVDSDKVKRAAIKLGCLTFKTPFLRVLMRSGGWFLFSYLGLGRVFDRVNPRLSKWKMKNVIWRFYTQDTSLWVRVIKAIYGEAGNMDAKVKAGSTSCWMSIVHEAKSLVNKGIDLFKFMHFKLGNGENARFWEDRWIEGDTLKKRFPRLYALELCKEITVALKVTQPSLAFSFPKSPRGRVEQNNSRRLVSLVHDVA
ncbi:RNA-directed DNA polymerase, eukaryota, partial [Tanacetum coccineum]